MRSARHAPAFEETSGRYAAVAQTKRLSCGAARGVRRAPPARALPDDEVRGGCAAGSGTLRLAARLLPRKAMAPAARRVGTCERTGPGCEGGWCLLRALWQRALVAAPPVAWRPVLVRVEKVWKYL